MSWDLVLRHCSAIRATLDQTRVSLELQSAQLAGLEAFAKGMYEREAAPTARISLPDHCTEIAEQHCALRNEDARIDHASLTHPRKWVCDGCRVISLDGVTT